MPKALTSWSVSPHGPLVQLEDNLWRVEQALPQTLPRVMTVVRMSDGRLIVHSAIALDEASMKRLEQAGEVAFLVVPNGGHRRDARIFKDRYPSARVVTPRGAQKRVEEVVPVDLTYEQFPGDDTVQFETLDGVGEQEGAVIVRSGAATTVVLNDAIFNMPHQPGALGFALRLLGSSGGPRVTRVGKLAFVKDKDAFRRHLERLAARPGLRRVIVSHVDVIEQAPAEALRRAAAAL